MRVGEIFKSTLEKFGINTDAESGKIISQISDFLGNNDISSVIERFKSQGLGEVVSSWVGKGENLPISSEQISSVLGSEWVQGVATKIGISPQDMSEKVSRFLPTIIDKLTPDGQLPKVKHNCKFPAL